MKKYNNSIGLIIKPVFGDERTIFGEVSSNYYPGCKETCYYCGWESFPEEIVVGIRYQGTTEYIRSACNV